MPPTRRRPPIRWSTRIAGGLALLVITASGVGHAVLTGVSGAIDRVDAFGGMEGRPDGSKGTNFLLVGTDGRDGLDPAEKKAYHLGGAPCHCTDTIMLVHLSADRSRASIVSIPRDTYVRLPDHPSASASPTAPVTPASSPPPSSSSSSSDPSASGTANAAPATDAQPDTHPAKINEAYADGGPKLTVRTVEQMTGVHIDHYLEIDFTSFMKTVDVIGGVQVCTTRPLKDSYTGLDLPVGTSKLDGGQALQYVRARHLDAAADLGRMQRQQRFMAQIIHKVTSGGVLANPLELSKVASTVLGSVRADQNLKSSDLIDLAEGMKNFSAGSSEFGSVPLSDTDYEVDGVGSTVKWDTAKAGKMWAAIRADRPLAVHHAKKKHKGVKVDVAPATIRVSVENGTDTSGLAATAQKALAATGFATVGTPGTSEHRSERTVIHYDPGWDRSAASLATALPGAELVAVPGQGKTMRVTLGTDFKAVTPVTADPGSTGTEDTPLTGDDVGC
ncbi:transcriptional attenuator, LytR family [Actinacidiphila alni]|uniref:Transcriptional attenuator, LytR family n=1 Tax=Actinacidiphila alni TaxID=380248 RepID=A0A1I2FSV2_9ACTN|nr:LCP family protein [Actinacidiphila alni]SFF07878.1 transcriptional attenuator, LytR family [Actinacidiphila alni]